MKPYYMRYSRDPSLAPQLVWKWKDEQDVEDLEFATMPIYRQEYGPPRQIIE